MASASVDRGMNLLQRGYRGLVKVITCPFLRLTVENAPDLGRLSPVILAPNHCSFLDPPMLQLACHHHLTFLMTEVIYSRPLVRPLFSIWDAIPIPESGSSAGAMKGALLAIKRQRPVVIFPEGRISLDGYLNPGRGGVVTLMTRAQVPVIPVAILGTHRALPKGRLLWRSNRITIRFGDPIEPPGKLPRDEVPAFADRIMSAIHALGAPRRPEGLEEREPDLTRTPPDVHRHAYGRG